MPTLTPAQQLAATKRAQRQQSVAVGTEHSADVSPVALSVMLGQGNTVTIEGVDYEVAAFPLGKLSQAGQLLQNVPEILTMHCLAAGEDGFDIALTAALMRRFAALKADPNDADTQTDAVLTEEFVSYTLQAATLDLTEEQTEAMTKLVVLALSRRHPEVTVESLADVIDIQVFLSVLSQIFIVNPGLRQRF